MKLPIEHIGIPRALCDGRKRAYLRSDLGEDRYKQLGVSERFKDQAPYKICAACIKALPTQYLKRRRAPLPQRERK